MLAFLGYVFDRSARTPSQAYWFKIRCSLDTQWSLRSESTKLQVAKHIQGDPSAVLTPAEGLQLALHPLGGRVLHQLILHVTAEQRAALPALP